MTLATQAGDQVPPLQQVDRTYVVWRGRRLSYFGGCDYFRLSSHPKVLAAVQDGLKRYGLNVAASRITTGNHRLYSILESRLAKFFGTDEAILTSSGYLTNQAVTQSLAGEVSHALIDERSHASLWDAAKFLSCPVTSFAHKDLHDFARRLRRVKRSASVILLTDGVFGQDGGIAPLGSYLELLPRTAIVLVDDAHGAGVLGENGAGTPAYEGICGPRIVQTISLSKAFGVYGGAILCGRALASRIRTRSNVFKANTPLPLPLANATLAGVSLLETQPALRRRLNQNIEYFKTGLCSGGINPPDYTTPIIALSPRRLAHAGHSCSHLTRRGIFPSLIRYGDSPPYFRFAISSEHSQAQLQDLVSAITEKATRFAPLGEAH